MSAFEEAIEIRDRILRGDMMIGILPFEAIDEMLEKFAAAGEAGNPAGWFELGQCMAQGLGTEHDADGAIAAFTKAWSGGFGRDAGLALVRTAYFSRSDAIAPEEVLATMETLLADDADGSAALLAGWMHYAGYAFDHDDARAIEFHKQAAEKGNGDAMFELSVLYGTGQGVEMNPAAAFQWCQRAAEAGSARAMYNLGAAAAAADDWEGAVHWYDAAAHAGHGRAAGVLSVMYATGDGVEADAARSEEYYELAWENDFDAFELFEVLGVEPPFE